MHISFRKHSPEPGWTDPSQRTGNKLKVKKEAPAKEKIIKYSRDFEGSLNDVECIKLVGVSRNTYYKYKRELINSVEL